MNQAGETVTVKAKAVILTTGGYGSNPEMTARFAAFNPIFNSAASSTGDGLTMAGKVGAQIFESDGMQPVSYTHLDVYKRQILIISTC